MSQQTVRHHLEERIRELTADVAAKNTNMQFNGAFSDIDQMQFTGAGVTVTEPSPGVLDVAIPGGGGGGGGGLTAAQVGARMALGI